MVERTRIRLLAGALAAAVLPGLPGCVGPPYAGPPPRGYPPWYDDYYYYPHVGVYFHIYSGHYWYRHGPRWRRVRRLPPHIRLHPRHRVHLRVPGEHPYRRHDEHRRRYPPPPEPRPDRRTPPPQARPQPGLPPPQPRRQPGLPPQPRPQPGLPPPQPRPGREREERESRDRDREERQHNTRRYEEYRKKKPWIRPQE